MKTTTGQTIEYSSFAHAGERIYLAASGQALCYVGTPGQTLAELEAWVMRRFPGAYLQANNAALEPAAQELTEFLAGRRQTFTVPVARHGTPFQEQVWSALDAIRYGDTCSYSDIAAVIGRPAAVRAVAAAIGANPVLIAVPCHRVVGKNGTLTGYRGGLAFKRFLLELEQRGNLWFPLPPSAPTA
jgi:methylated-DNA-[protein]-cysteine S-methyltransferase